MQTRKLGNSDLEITRIGFGAWAIGGGGWQFGWGPQDDAESIGAIREAIDLGINWIDTAAVYGLGHSEEVVAKALAGVRDRPYVFTKCERVWDDNRQIGKSLKAASIRAECEASLKRLKVERIDLYQIHWPEPEEDIEEGWSELAKLKAEGKVRWIAVSNFNVAQMKRAQAIAPITSLQPPYHLLNRAVEPEILPYAREQGIGVIPYSPMASGLLTGAMTRERIAAFPADDWRRNNPNYKEPLLTRNLALVEKLKSIGVRGGVGPGVVAIAWVLANPAVTGAIVGARRPGQLGELVAAADFTLTAAELESLAAAIA
ncbi:MAG TPA: aldo/keto reductase [Planctomycetia bacterium]|nr:aldo/keto reductase [Planctomycetia bacterium]